MNKSDYLKLAMIINNHTITSANDGYKFIGYLDSFLNELCVILKADNPRFDEELFKEACK